MANFSLTPSVNIARTKFNRVNSHKTTLNLGDIVPIYCEEVLPGDTHSLDYSSLIRMSTPISPIMDDIYLELFAFFVPNRLTWNHWKEFCGENSLGAGAVDIDSYEIPMVDVSQSELTPHSIGSYLGLPYNADGGMISVSELPLRAYFLIKNRWFRNQNLEAPIPVDIGDYNNEVISYLEPCQVASKKGDYFTKSQPYAQKSVSPVMLPLGTSAPIVNTAAPGSNIVVGFQYGSVSSNTGSGPVSANWLPGSTKAQLSNEHGPIYSYFNPSSMSVDLTAAYAATINQLRETFAIQRMFEKDSLYGSRFWEILYGHFGVRSPDATLQDPELLGSAKIDININQVLQTTGYASDEGSMLGALGANSVSGSKGSLFTKSFVEHGYIMVMAVARHKNTYSQGINRMFTRKKRFDFYWPTFARLGAQSVLNKEIYATGDPSNDDAVFGYQDSWAEYRYKPSITTGYLNPAVDDSMAWWVLTEKYGETPTLSTSFTKVNRHSLARALTTGENGPDFMADFAFFDTAVRPMPLNSIPGLTEWL